MVCLKTDTRRGKVSKNVPFLRELPYMVEHPRKLGLENVFSAQLHRGAFYILVLLDFWLVANSDGIPVR